MPPLGFSVDTKRTRCIANEFGKQKLPTLRAFGGINTGVNSPWILDTVAAMHVRFDDHFGYRR